MAGAETEESQPTSYSDYTVVKDESNIIQVEVPVEWSQVNDSPWTRDGQNVGVGISASADLNRFAEYYDQPGIDFLVSRQIAQTTNEDQLLAQFDQSENCTKANSKEPYDDGLYTGVYDIYTCPNDSTVIVLTFVPENRAYVGLVYVQALSEADFEALERVVASFQVIGTFPN